MSRYLHYTPGAVPQVAGYNLAQAQAPAQVEGQGAKILNAALGAGREALGIVARDYNRYQTCRVSDLVERTDRRFEEWKANWTRENQGVNATDAQKIFAGKYEELSNEALEEFGGSDHEIYRHELEKKLLARGLMAFRDGGSYQKQQTELWEKSVWDGKLAAYEQACSNNVDDPERLAYMRKELLEHYGNMNGGQDISAIDLKLRRMQYEIGFSANMARGDLGGAETILEKGSGGFGHAARANGSAPNTGKTIAEDLNNPLNLKKVGHSGGSRSDFEFFQTIDDGFRGAANQLRLYKTRYGKKTPREMVRRWAPASDNNNHAAYFRNMAAAGLKDIDAEIDVDNPRQMAMLLKAMATAECGPLAAKYSVDQIEGFLSANGGKARKVAAAPGQAGEPVMAGAGVLDPARQIQMQNALAARRSKELHALREQARQNHDDFVAQCREGIVPDMPDASAYAPFGDQAAAKLQEAEAAREYGLRLDAMKKSPLSAHAALIESMRPQPGSPGYEEKRKFFHELESEAGKMAQAWKKDSAAWLSSNDENVRKARSGLWQKRDLDSFNQYVIALKSAREQRGITDRKLLSEVDAQSLADRISTDPGSDPGLVIDAYQQLFGSHAPQIMQEIMPKAGNMINIIGNMSSEFASERKALFQAARDKNYEKTTADILGLNGIVKTQFEQLVMEELKDFNLTLGAGGNSGMASDLASAVNMLARHYLVTGLEDDHGKAIHRAAENVVLGSYELLSNRNKDLPYRVPKNLPAREIGKGADNWLHDASLDGCHVEHRPDMPISKQNEGLASVIRNQAYWVTNENESGLSLMLAGRRICDKEGNPVNVTWDELYAMRETEGSKKRNAGRLLTPEGAAAYSLY